MRYVAIGDSFTEGVGDERPDGSLRGWADRLAVELAAWQGQPIEYANLAIRGRTLRPIVTEQLDHALRLNPAPTMITLNGGGNDMLRPGTDAQQLIALTEAAVRRCLDAGVSAVLLSGADPSQHLPFGKVLRRRGTRRPLSPVVPPYSAPSTAIFASWRVATMPASTIPA